MQLLSITLMETAEGFEDRLTLEFDILRVKGLQIVLRKRDFGQGGCHYTCFVDDETPRSEYPLDIRGIFLRGVANALSDFVINHWELGITKRIIEENYFYLGHCEQDKILEFTERILRRGESLGKMCPGGKAKRKNILLHKILDYVKEHRCIIVDGFVRFRLADYIEQLEEAVDKAFEDYFMEREYREFINLLQQFVDIQTSKKQTVNVVFNEGDYCLYDENMSVIEKNFWADMDLDPEDRLVSTLINLSPKHIVIHGDFGEEKREMINTLLKIFVGRVSFCNHCKICLKLIPLKTK